MKPVVSVILTVHNTEEYLGVCLDSLIAQTLKDIEIICVDDASTDHSVDLICRYQNTDKRISLIRLAKNKGSGYARNEGLKKVKGKYVAVLDADDFFEKDFLEKLYRRAEKTRADITFCSFYLFDNQSRNIQTVSWDINRQILPKSTVFRMSAKRFNLLPSFVWNQLYRRDFIQKNHLHFVPVFSFSDVYFNKTALLKAKRISCIDERLVYYRFNNQKSISHNLNALDGIRTIYALKRFLKRENLLKNYQQAFFETSLLKMNRVQNLAEPYQSLLRSFYQRRLIPKIWPNRPIPSQYISLRTFDTCSDTFRDFFFNRREHIVPVVLATNSSNVALTSVVIESVFEKADLNYFYDIYILHSDLSEATCFNLRQLSCHNLRITPIHVSFRGKHLDFTKYLFLIPTLFKGYDRMLYLANSTLVQNDLSALLKLDLTGYEIAAVSVHCSPKTVKSDLNRKNNVDPDVVLFNMSLAQQTHLADRLMACCEQMGMKSSPRQVLNAPSLKQKLLPAVWNSPVIRRRRDCLFWNSDKKNVPDQNALILNYHFNPCQHVGVSGAKRWFKVARNSLFYEFIAAHLTDGFVFKKNDCS